MKLVKFLSLILLFSTKVMLCQNTLEFVESFTNDIFTEGKTKVLLIDYIKIEQSDSIYRKLEAPIKFIFTKEDFILEDFSLSSHSNEKGKINEFQRGETGVYGAISPYSLRSTLYLNNDFINDVFELSFKFDEESIQKNEFQLKLMNTGFDFYFIGRIE